MPEYKGAEFLQVSKVMRNYNRSIATMVCRFGAGAKHVLDFGAGIGTISEVVRELGLIPICLEPDPKQCRELLRLGFTCVGSLDEIANGSLDYIYSSNVLEHIEDDVSLLKDFLRKLRPGGMLFLYIPAFQSLFSSMDRAVGHYRRYELDMLRQKLLVAGFALDQLFYTDVLGYFATKCFKAMGNDFGKVNPLTLNFFDRVIFPVGQAIEQLIRVPVGKNLAGVAYKR